MKPHTLARALRAGSAAALLVLAAGCGSLLPKSTPPPQLYSLDGAPAAPAAAAPASAPTLMVHMPRAAAGFDSHRMIYVREPHRLEYFAHSEWVDSPARMLAPLMVATLGASGAFGAVVPASGAAAGDLGLETEIVRLQHDFGTVPSRVRFTLRATLVGGAARKVVAWREFDVSVPAPGDDPYGGVLAANLAVQAVLGQMSAWCAGNAAGWPRLALPLGRDLVADHAADGRAAHGADGAAAGQDGTGHAAHGGAGGGVAVTGRHVGAGAQREGQQGGG